MSTDPTKVLNTVLSIRRAKVDIVDTLLIEDGIVSDWYFTSSSTGVRMLQSESQS